MRTLKEMIEQYKESHRNERVAELRAMFAVEERGGALWLTHSGVAFKQISDNASAAEVAYELNQARATAVKFEGYADLH